MTRKILWLALTCLIVLGLVLASCGPAEEEEEEEGKTVVGEVEEEEVTAEEEEEEVTEGKEMVRDSLGRLVEKPRYGGVVHYALDRDSLPGFVPEGYIDGYGTFPCYEGLLIPDLKTGPSGTGEYSIASQYCPPESLIGLVAESWEQPDLQTLIFKIRQGVRFHDKPPVNGREVTADDFVWSLYRCQEYPKSEFYMPPETPENQLVHATALDKWTVEVKLPSPDPFRVETVGKNIVLIPREMFEEKGSFEDWRNECGTGPFTITDAVTGTSITYSRSSNYWMTDPFHPENRLPYVDEIKLQLIRDPATRLAALRTGKIEVLMGITLEDAEMLWQSNPELNYKQLPPSGSRCVYLNCGTEPFQDIKMRQAVFMATDFDAIVKEMYKGQAEILTWPFISSVGPEIYTPIEELPTEITVDGSGASARDLFSYDPDKARQLMAEAGYPNGLKISLYSGPGKDYSETIPVITHYWGDIGIECEVDVMEEAVLWGHTMTVTYPNAARCGWGNAPPAYAFEYGYRTGHPWNSCGVVDPYLDTTWDEIKATLDPVERNTKWKELAQYAIEQAYYYTFPAPFRYTFWQPWVKQYNGEQQMGRLWNYYAFAQFCWIDEDLRLEMR